MKLLIIDDSAPLRLQIASYLSRHGFKVFEAPDGLVAEKIISDNKIDIIVSDFCMIGLNGIEINKRYPHIPMLLISGGFVDEKKLKIPFLSKPFERLALLNKIEEIIQENKKAV